MTQYYKRTLVLQNAMILVCVSFALAVGLALPLLSVLGFQIGGGNENIISLKITYVALPIAIKLYALWLLKTKQNYLQQCEGHL